MKEPNPLFQIEQTSEEIERFLQEFGKVFKVFDKQDSGCISYGVEVNGERWFVKYSNSEKATPHLRNAIRFHSDIRSSYIPALHHSFQAASGLALVYEWVEGEVLSPPEFAGAEGKKNPLSPFYRFRQLTVDQIIKVLTIVYDLHAYIAKVGYIAVDFYAGSMIYDFQADEIRFCDFDHYVKGAFHLEQDRLPGSRSLMAPEEFVKGSLIDQRTNVYTMGAVAFMLLGSSSDRKIEYWRASEELFAVASKAVSEEREKRYASIHEFNESWLSAIGGHS